MSRTGPLVQFARFVNGQIELFKERTDQLDYIAISHVWGDIDWRHVKGVLHEIKVSSKKAKFIEDKLPALVGDHAFWMDTITVNQRDQAEVIGTVQAIPTIFRDASRTIAVREGDGLYPCCVAATEGFTSWEDFGERLQKHSDEHYSHTFDETYLSRLWTLQECQLSHTIQFVNTHEDIEERQKPADEPSDPYMYHLNYERVSDALYTLAHAFDERMPAIEAFIRAYMCQGTVTRKVQGPRTRNEDIYSDNFLFMHLASNRRASEPRDYMFATMPQFPWYRYPASAEKMSFNSIFQDFYTQATKSGHAFAHRITRSMTEPADRCSSQDAWLPSTRQPEPKRLGDFLKLLGQKIQSASPLGNIHLCSIVQVDARTAALDYDSTVAVVENAMKFSSRAWRESHIGGELSLYGCSPEDVAQHDRFRQLAIASWERSNPSSEHTDEERIRRSNSLRTELETKKKQRLQFPWLHKQAMRMLDLKWLATDKVRVSKPHRGDWLVWSRSLSKSWSAELQHFVILLAAMVSCQIPLSAVLWADEHFTPVLITFKTRTVLGLLAKHAVKDDKFPEGKKPMLCAGRHPAEEPLGKDLVLADIWTKKPVGLVPDFLELIRTGEEFVERVSELYYMLQPFVTPNGAVFRCCPLEDVGITATG